MTSLLPSPGSATASEVSGLGRASIWSGAHGPSSWGGRAPAGSRHLLDLGRGLASVSVGLGFQGLLRGTPGEGNRGCIDSL